MNVAYRHFGREIVWTQDILTPKQAQIVRTVRH